MKKLLLLLTLPLLAACAPAVTTAAPTVVTTSARYSVTVTGNEDNPVLAAVVAAAPTAPPGTGRQPWRAEEVERNSVVLRSRASVVSTGSFGSFINTLPQEMVFNVVTSGGVTTLTVTHSSAYAATVQHILDRLDGRFNRLR